MPNRAGPARGISILLAALWCVHGAAAQATDDPLSAIDWLNAPQVGVQPRALPRSTVPSDTTPRIAETPVSPSANAPQVLVTPLDAPRADAVGLLPGAVTGLPASLWRASDSATLQTLIAAQDTSGQPAMTALYFTLLLAEAEAPRDAGPDPQLLLARIDALIRLGAVAPARALLERAGTDTPQAFARYAEIDLLTGTGDSACLALAAGPHLSSDPALQVFCAARGGDWVQADTILRGARALALIPDRRAALLEHFLEPEMGDTDAGDLSPPVRPSALEFRLYEAIGAALPTVPLPRAFAVTDLGGDSGWKAQIEAAERLTRAGALPENQLLGIWTARQPAASGGVWDRVEAVQRFDVALSRRDPTAVTRELPRVWAQMQAAGLQVAFARLFGGALLDVTLTGTSEKIAINVALLSPDYERAAERTDDALLAGIARGDLTGVTATGDQAEAIVRAWNGATPPDRLAQLLTEGKLGEALLRAMALYGQGAQGDPAQITDALATLRAVGLEDTARRAALQLVLLYGPT